MACTKEESSRARREKQTNAVISFSSSITSRASATSSLDYSCTTIIIECALVRTHRTPVHVVARDFHRYSDRAFLCSPFSARRVSPYRAAAQVFLPCPITMWFEQSWSHRSRVAGLLVHIQHRPRWTQRKKGYDHKQNTTGWSSCGCLGRGAGFSRGDFTGRLGETMADGVNRGRRAVGDVSGARAPLRGGRGVIHYFSLTGVGTVIFV